LNFSGPSKNELIEIIKKVEDRKKAGATDQYTQLPRIVMAWRLDMPWVRVQRACTFY